MSHNKIDIKEYKCLGDKEILNPKSNRCILLNSKTFSSLFKEHGWDLAWRDKDIPKIKAFIESKPQIIKEKKEKPKKQPKKTRKSKSPQQNTTLLEDEEEEKPKRQPKKTRQSKSPQQNTTLLELEEEEEEKPKSQPKKTRKSQSPQQNTTLLEEEEEEESTEERLLKAPNETVLQYDINNKDMVNYFKGCPQKDQIINPKNGKCIKLGGAVFSSLLDCETPLTYRDFDVKLIEDFVQSRPKMKKKWEHLKRNNLINESKF